uniref:FH2 domain-containing protein 1-like n=1 Tax=Gouania willdenowi TaxID=441366 RepID=A0A8C5N7V8_GOUWI
LLNWDTIPSHSVLGKLNVWTRPQRDLVLDIQSMEELFSHVDKQTLLQHSKTLVKWVCHFVPLFQDIYDGNCLKFEMGNLKELYKLLPENNEVKQLLSFNGNLSMLPEADQFMVQLVKVPCYEDRLKMMVLRQEFLPLMEEVKNSVAIMSKAANELLDCDDLHSVIRLVLKAGNYMNAGGYSANAIGFRMTSLLKLADTKANKPGMNLMHYVAKQVEDIDAELLTFPTQLEHIGMASRICKEEVVTDYEREAEKIREVKLFTCRQPSLLQQMDAFLVDAEAKLTEVELSVQELKALSNDVAEYFCEDPATFKLDECCSIFHSFCTRFNTALNENKEREAAEQRRKRKDSIRTTVKRRSTVSGPKPERYRNSLSLESALQNFLSTAPEGVNRCRKNILPEVKGSPAGCSSSPGQVAEKTQVTPGASPVNFAKKESKLHKEEETAKQELKEEVEKMREISRKVLHYQKSKGSLFEKPATPKTPQPRTRDFFFANNIDLGSPWTVLSPFSCTKTKHLNENKQTSRDLQPSAYGGDDLDDGVWVSDEGSNLSSYSDQDSQSSSPAESSSFPECRRPRSLSQGVIVRSVDETGRSSPQLRLGGLFQRRTDVYLVLGGRSKKREEQHVNSSGFLSFFKRIGGRRKTNVLEEKNVKGFKI